MVVETNVSVTCIALVSAQMISAASPLSLNISSRLNHHRSPIVMIAAYISQICGNGVNVMVNRCFIPRSFAGTDCGIYSTAAKYSSCPGVCMESELEHLITMPPQALGMKQRPERNAGLA